MISKDTYLYNSDPLIGQWNKIQNITFSDKSACAFEHAYFFFFFYTYVYIIFCLEGFVSANINYMWKCSTRTLMQV